jgi:hypothetical protein
MSKEEWEEAKDALYEHLDREPTDDEIRDYISGRHDYLYEMYRDMELEERDDG